ncbi:MAG: hypothetical protein KF680_11060 [Cryobacterium sp.]|nr:hypothetical protein [Cryobacterium sp.]
MPVDDEHTSGRMRELLSEHADRALTSASELNAADVIRRSRRRRAPRQAALGAVSALALAGVLIVAVPAVIGSGMFGTGASLDAATTMSESYGSGERDYAPEAPYSIAPACEELASSEASSAKGLTVSLTARAVPSGATDWHIDSVIDVRNNNTGQSHLSGIAWASLTLTQNGVAVAHSAWYPAEESAELEYLGPGETASHSISFAPEWCDGVPLRGVFEVTVGVTLVSHVSIVSESIILASP